jgi:glutamate formiminotransferase
MMHADCAAVLTSASEAAVCLWLCCRPAHLQLAATVHAVATHALEAIDLTAHAAQHPRLGVLDHVSIHPIGPDATLPFAAQAAAAVGQQLSQPPLQLPVYYYGAAQRDQRRLADIRKRLGELFL